MKKTGVVIFTDGGSRVYPGKAGAGASVCIAETEVATVSEYLGVQTNNWAEYEALVLALVAAEPFSEGRRVEVYMDSELIVKQMNGEYRVKDPELKKQHAKVQKLLAESFPEISFAHVRREKNERADELANKAMDREKN